MLKFLFVCALGVLGCLGIDEQQSCDEQCTPTYPLHTYPQTQHYFACSRGCRLAHLGQYTSDGTAESCNKTCNEAYASDAGAAYACNVGCSVSLNTMTDNDIVQISMINSVMDMLFVTHVIDMLSYDNREPTGDVSEGWTDEVDVYLSKDWISVNSSADDNTPDVTWSVYSLVWFFDSPPSHVTTSTQVDTSEEVEPPTGYYLVYYKHWSLTQAGFFSQLICYITLFLFIVALLKCCHMFIYDDSNDDSKGGLSVKADNGYESNDDDDDGSDDDDEVVALLQKKRQQYMTGIVQKPAHTERVLLSMSSFLPVQNTKLNSGGKVEGILTVV